MNDTAQKISMYAEAVEHLAEGADTDANVSSYLVAIELLAQEIGRLSGQLERGSYLHLEKRA
jgi:hypothetical protein